MKKLIVLLLALALMLTALPCGVFADDANLYFAGKGTAEEPYLIQTPEDLAKLVYLTNENYQDKGLYSTTAEIIIPDTTTKWELFGSTGWYASRPGSGSLVRYYKMTADLDMTGYDFSQGGIGGENSYSRFRGSFDGNGHIIKNWNGYSTAGSDNNAIFTNVSFGEYEDQGIKNLGIENAKIKSSNHVCGILAGMCTAGGQAENSGFENCFVKNSESTVSTRSGIGPASGGIVGKVHLPYTGSTSINIKNCYVKNTSLYCGCAGDPAEHRHFDIGGIVGRVAMDEVSGGGGHKCFITNCYSIGVSGKESLYAIGVLSGPTSLSLITDFSNCYSVDEEKADTWSLLKFDAINKAFIAEKTGLPAPKSTDFADNVFADDTIEVNDGLPMLKWEYDRWNSGEDSAITLKTNAHGKVLYRGGELSDGDIISSKVGLSVAIEVISDKGYDAEVNLDGEKVSYSGNTLIIYPKKSAHTLSITFNELPKMGNRFYVDPEKGSADNDGTAKDKAFDSITTAKEAIKKYRDGEVLGDGNINVYIKGGEYRTETGLTFGKDDSGTAQQKIIYQPYEGEKVTFTGAEKIDTSKIKKVTDESILNRLSESYARDNIYMLDLKAEGIELPPLRATVTTSGQKFYMNGTALTNARWPNPDKTGEQYYVRGETGTLTAEQQGKYNGGGQPAVLKYVDAKNRTSNWQIKKDDAFLCGAIAYLWWPECLLIDTLDTAAKVVTTSGKASYGQNTYTAKTERYLYFENIFEEIDQPGESYLDRESGILYFYPVGKVNGAEMYLSKTGSNLLTINGAEHITFKDLDFKNGTGNAMNITGSSITVDGSEISGMGANGIKINGSNITVKNCDIYNYASHGIDVSGGDRATLTPSGNVITNNKVHSGYGQLSRGIYAAGVGHEISHNDIFDFGQDAIRYDKLNNTVIEYNDIYDVQLLNADGGAIYAGRNCTDLGNIVRYNYFHDIGAHIGHHGQQAVFTDDGEVGPAIYGNIIYKGGLPDYPLKTHGGQFHQIYNNIIIENNVGFYMQPWGVGDTGVKNAMIPARWFVYMTDLQKVFGSSSAGSNLFESRKDLIFSSEWKKYYTETESTKYWAKVFDFINSENYNAAKGFSDKGDAAGFTAWMENNLPAGDTNFVYNNVLIDIPTVMLSGGWAELKNNLQASSKSAKNWFTEYGKDFTLNDGGMAEIRKTIPDFEKPEFSKMGVQDESTAEPAITNASILGSAAVGKTLSAKYDYSGANDEGSTEIYWYYANSKNGSYKRITDGFGKYYTVDSVYENKYIRYEAVPKDVKYTHGETAVSESVYIDPNATTVDKDGLWSLIEKVNGVLDEAVVGTEGGQYDQESKDALTAARDKALSVANNANAYQYQVTEAEAELETALDIFKKSVHDILSTLGVERISLKECLEDEAGWNKSTGDDLKFENGALIIGDGSATLAEYTAKKYRNTQFSFKMKPEIIDPDAANAANAWVGIYLRQQKNGWCWNGGNGAAMFDLKQQLIQYQQHPKPLTWSAAIHPDLVLNDKKLEMGKTYDVSVGVYETKTDGEILIELTLDGEKVYMDSIFGTELTGTEGMFAISAGNNTRLTVYAAEADKTELNAEIAAAESFVSGAKTGNGYGEYPKDAIDSVNAAIADAKKVSGNGNAVQFEVDEAALKLKKAANAAKGMFNQSGSVGETVTINYGGEKAELTVPDSVSKVTVNAEKDKALPKFSAKAKDFEMTAEDGSIPGGSFELPTKTAEPSGSFKLGDVSGVYGGGYTKFNKPVRIVLYGEGGKQAAYKNEKGGYVQISRTIREDSFAAAETALSDGKTVAVKFTSGNDLIIYTTAVTEFVTYTKTASEPYEPSVTPGGGNGGTTTKPSGNKGTNGFYSGETTNPSISNPFTDMAGHWAAADVLAMNKAGIVSGVSDTLFDPDRNITRAEFAAIIARALKLSDKKADYKDVNDEWFAPYVGACSEAGIISGYDGMFRPNDNITRQEMAVIIVNAYSYLEGKGANGGIDNFTDKAEIADWAKAAVDTASSVGLISGMGDGTFSPSANATRAQAASIVKRLLDK